MLMRTPPLGVAEAPVAARIIVPCQPNLAATVPEGDGGLISVEVTDFSARDSEARSGVALCWLWTR